MNSRLAIEPSHLTLSLFIAFNNIPRLQITLEVLKGETTFQTLLHLRDILLQLLHTVKFQIILKDLLSPHYSIFVFPFELTRVHF